MIKLLLSLTSAAVAASGEPLAKGIQDNSFLIEELTIRSLAWCSIS
jgi:hypothetical protein